MPDHTSWNGHASTSTAVSDHADSSRRKFFSRVIQIVQGSIGAVIAVLAGGAIAGPALVRDQENWLAAAALDDLVDGQPTPVVLRVARDDGYAQTVDRQVIFLVRSGESAVHALSSTCTHLGCRVSWVPESQQLKCPCHGGVYDRNGAVLSGPPPAPLASLSTKVEDGQVLVRV